MPDKWWNNLKGVALVSEFDQARYERARTANAEGYCRGCCLDWVRRVLLKPDTSLAGYGVTSSKKYSYGTQEYYEKPPASGRSAGKSARRMSAVQSNLDSDHSAVRDFKQRNTQALLTRVDTMLVSKGAGYARKTGKQFADLELAGEAEFTMPVSMDQWYSQIVVMLSGGDTALILGLDFDWVDRDDDEEPAGHAVAVGHFGCRPDQYVFFDPNYGVFHCTADGLKTLLNALFEDDGVYDEKAHPPADRTRGPTKPDGKGVFRAFRKKQSPASSSSSSSSSSLSSSTSLSSAMH